MHIGKATQGEESTIRNILFAKILHKIIPVF
jgi:hypothetical protein